MNNKKFLTIAGLMIGVVIVIGGIYTTVIANSQHQNGMSMETKTFQNLNSEATESKNQSIISLGFNWWIIEVVPKAYHLELPSHLYPRALEFASLS